MSAAAFNHRIATVRRFNRFYTQKIGVLEEGLLQSRFSLTEARVLYELAHRDRPAASELARELHLDPGYLSRILRSFRRQGLIDRARAAGDGRRSHLSLTTEGETAFAPLDKRSRDEIAALLAPLTERAQRRLIAAMRGIEQLLDPVPAREEAFVLRPPQPGDIGWVAARHGAIYAAEYGFGSRFEALVAEIAAGFVTHLDPHRERCWIAEKDGEPVGSVFLVKDTDSVAKLRLLLVEPTARGLGIGQLLVEECVGFARAAGYRKITLWTQSVLTAARRIYQAAGFDLVRTEPHHSFGHDLVGEYWELAL
jgi:DNA-binding MarR family transcriptional regulator/N-acetylglutamate synthase-like GNAT family acetyltransferase